MDLNNTQREVFLYIKEYAETYKVPVPREKILSELNLNPNMIPAYLASLIRKGYIKRSMSSKANYIVLRTI